ncbi:MAG: ubiquinone/menaquinone biosynthesis C-methylase UbiE [Planctomycetota bacterium]|jgi:ubiquinone/menaquinone biosynthesis C-methylase UbiE
MSDNQNEGFERAYQSSEFAGYYGEKHERTATLRFRDRREHGMWARLIRDLPQLQTILDCPAGAGRYWEFLGGLGGEVTAVDSSAEMMESGKVVHADFAPANSHVAMAQDLPFDDSSFDLVFCSRLLHHFPVANDRQQILKSFCRVTRGHVAFSTWRTGNLKHMQNRGRKETQSRFFISMDDIKRDVECAGLEVVNVVHKQRWLSPLVAVLCQPKSK